MAIKTVVLDTLTLAGTTGSQISTQSIKGKILALYVLYTGQTTPSLTIGTNGTAGKAPAQTIIVIATFGTSGWFYPRLPAVNAANAAITNSFVEAIVDDTIKLNCTAGGATGSIIVTLLIDDLTQRLG